MIIQPYNIVSCLNPLTMLGTSKQKKDDSKVVFFHSQQFKKLKKPFVLISNHKYTNIFQNMSKIEMVHTLYECHGPCVYCIMVIITITAGV